MTKPKKSPVKTKKAKPTPKKPVFEDVILTAIRDLAELGKAKRRKDNRGKKRNLRQTIRNLEDLRDTL